MPFFDRLRRLLPGPVPSGAFGRGTHELERGRLDDADAAFAEALATAVTSADIAAARNKRAIIAIRRRDVARAIEELVAALEAEPRSAAAITTIGNLLLEDGAVDEAIVHYEYAIVADDAYAPAYHNLGVALHRSGRKREAVGMLRKATRLEGRIRRP
ncbi:MAG: repeat-containing protein [Candidatus Eremiobacteraeota bacterium]|nr:repeat-containing protein [Candidatus Eremiobacteraeota bacterium]